VTESAGELDHKAICDRAHNDRRLVKLAAASPDVPDNGERSERGPCEPAGQGIQSVLEHDEPAIPELLLKVHRSSSIPNSSETAVTRRSKLHNQNSLIQ
jgi:hypothetical protein